MTDKVWLPQCHGGGEALTPCSGEQGESASRMGGGREDGRSVGKEGFSATEGVPMENTDYLLSKHQFDGETRAASQRPLIRPSYGGP